MTHFENTEALDAAIAARPAPKVTKADIDATIADKLYTRVTGTLTICVLTLHNGFTVTGQSACASPENYDQNIGEDLAYRDAYNKIWALEAYLLKQTQYEYDNRDDADVPCVCTYVDRVEAYNQ